MSISKECRNESWLQVEPQKRKRLILEAIGDKEMTARMVAIKISAFDMNLVRPRITEMVQDGILEVVGKAYDKVTERNVSVYKVKEKNDE